MLERLLVVKGTFPSRGGVEVLPAVASDRVPATPFDVTVRTPDGAERRAKATVIVAHIRGPLPPMAMVRLADLTVDAVPPGTELWVER